MNSSGLQRIRERLGANPALFTIVATLAAFGAYTAMYAFRKPFAAATFSGQRIGNFDLKVLLVVGQLIGYTLSKFIGIKVVSEAGPGRRITLIASMIGIAFASLIVFPLVPPWAKVICLFVNGLPLGMVWGLIFGFLEGRRVTEFLGLGMSVSFIFASGWTKSAGSLAMARWHVPEAWMPAFTGLMFIPLMVVCLVALALLPPPSAADVKERSVRAPMNAAQRRHFLLSNALPLALLILPYVFLTVYRDLRDTFMADVLKELGHKPDSAFFAKVETVVGLGVLAALAGLWFIRDHWRALGVYHVLIAAGAMLVGAGTLAFGKGLIGPAAWMILTGLGGYLGYVPFNSVLFDRLLAATRQVGTASFLIQVADSLGYLASASLYLQRTFLPSEPNWTRLTQNGGFALALTVPLLLLASWTFLHLRRNDVTKTQVSVTRP
jgi:MFS family permease